MITGNTDISLLADEYVLGLLDEERHDFVEAQIEQNTQLRNAVATSRERFLPLDLSVEEVPLSPSLWQRIDAGLETDSQVRRSLPAIMAANDDRASLWKRTAITSLAASVLLSVGLGWTLMRPVEPVVIAVLLNDAGEPQAVVEDFGNEQARIHLLADFTVPEGKTMQVWTLPSRDVGPVSLGLLEERGSARLSAPSLPRPKDEQLYEITLEQSGGSPTGRPTGPILVKGLAKAPR